MINSIAIVTGAGRGIGKAIAKELVKQGIHVIVNDFDVNLARQAVDEIGQSSSYYTCDVSDYNSVIRFISDIKIAYGRIDILVNNAGISPKKKGKKVPIFEMEPGEWQRVVETNLDGAFYMTRFVAPLMIEQKFGRIINMSSIAAKSYIDVTGCHYTSTKAGLIGLTKASAGELAPYGITVNAIAPGRIRTEMMEEVNSKDNELILAQIASGRFGKVEDVAGVVEFLVSDKASYITGAVINVDGGWVMA